MDLSATLTDLAARLEQTEPGWRAFVGFDGFVDEIVRAVDIRYGPDSYKPIETIAAFAQRIADAAGLSTNIELVTEHVKLGGNGPIMARALSSLGAGITYVGSVGRPDVHPIFAELEQAGSVVGVCPPGYTQALEFTDGKVLLGKTTSLAEITWERILDCFPLEAMRSALRESALIAALNWTMIPHLTQVWEGMLRDGIAALPAGVRPVAFFDLCDPAKREPGEIVKALETIERFSERTHTVLGLNRKEATEVANALGLAVAPSNREAPLEAITEALGRKLGIAGVVVHPVSEAAVYTQGSLVKIPGPYTSRPKLTTGAGDNFNAGFCFGLVSGFDPASCLLLGKGTSGFYVRNGRSPSKHELVQFLRTWAAHVDREF